MNSIYRSLIIKARNSFSEPPELTEPAKEAVLRVMQPLLEFAEELRLEGLLRHDPLRIDSPRGVEFRWALPEGRSLIIRGRGPVFNLRYRPRARIAAGVVNSDLANAWMPVYGSYLTPNSPKDGLRTHAVILECVADLVAVYGNGLRGPRAKARIIEPNSLTSGEVLDDLRSLEADGFPSRELRGVGSARG